MPSLILTSGIVPLVSGNIFSGLPFPIGGITLYYDRFAPANSSGIAIHIGVGILSGNAVTFASGGSMGSGGLSDGFPMLPGDYLWIPKSRMINYTTDPLQSGKPLAVQIGCLAGVSGNRLWWDWDIQPFK